MWKLGMNGWILGMGGAMEGGFFNGKNYFYSRK